MSDHIVIRKDEREIWLAPRHEIYRATMERDFEYYYHAITDQRDNVTDFSSPQAHCVRGFPANPVFCPSFVEPYDTMLQYLELGEVASGETVWDLGSHVGMASYAFSRAVGRRGKVLAAEPDPESFTAMLRNFSGEVRGVARIVTLPVAIWKTDGPVSFANDGTPGARIAQTINRLNPVVTGVMALSLSGFSAATCSIPDLIKLDIEGAEVAVLSDGIFLLEHRPRLLIEPHKLNGFMTTEECERRLRALDYDVRLEAQSGQSTPLIVAT